MKLRSSKSAFKTKDETGKDLKKSLVLSCFFSFASFPVSACLFLLLLFVFCLYQGLSTTEELASSSATRSPTASTTRVSTFVYQELLCSFVYYRSQNEGSRAVGVIIGAHYSKCLNNQSNLFSIETNWVHAFEANSSASYRKQLLLRLRKQKCPESRPSSLRGP